MTVFTPPTVDPRQVAVDDASARAITWRDHVWVTWHQYRMTIIAGALVTVAVCAVLLTYAAMFHHYAGCITPASSRCYDNYRISGRTFADILRALIFLPALGGAFWGAPVVARELEAGTLRIALGQDLSPRQWLLGRACVLGGALGGLAFAVATCAFVALPTAVETNPFSHDGNFDQKVFETGPATFIGYTLLAFSLGVTVGAIVRRTLPSVAIAGAGFFAIWYALRAVRSSYIPVGVTTWNRAAWGFELREAALCAGLAGLFLLLSVRLVRRPHALG